MDSKGRCLWWGSRGQGPWRVSGRSPDLASLHPIALDNRCFAIDAAPGQGYTARPPDGPPGWATGCPGGGIGRRAGFRYLWPQGRGSSSLLLGTSTLMADITQFMANASIHLHRHDLPEGITLGATVAVDTETM